MLIVGLTGSIGMGKSTAAKHLRARHIPVLDADAVVHRLYEGPLANIIEAEFPGVTVGGRVDRARLSSVLATKPGGFARLEGIVHPAVRHVERAFLKSVKERGAPVAVLEIPLLFETGADALVDVKIVVSATAEAQRERVLDRPGMSDAKLQTILSRQLPDAEKKARADFVVDTTGPVEDTQAQIDQILAELPGRPESAFDRCWDNGTA